MNASPRFSKLLEADRRQEASELLRVGVHQVGVTGERSSRAALEAAMHICAGDLLSTIYFMNKPHPWLDGLTPLERAEQSEEGIEFVIDMICAIEAGVYI